MASLWYCAVGHGRGEIADAIAAQIRTLAAYSCFDPFTNEPAEQLADELRRHRADGRRPGVLLLLGIRGDRLGDEARPDRPRAGRPAAAQADHLARPRLPRRRATAAPARRASPRTARTSVRSSPMSCRCRPTTSRRWSTLMAAARRHEVAAVHHRAGAGRSRHLPARPRGTSQRLRKLCDQHGAYLDLRRGDHRLRPARLVVRRAPLRRAPRPRHVRQGRHLGLPAARRRVRRPCAARRARGRRRLLPPPRVHVLGPRHRRAPPALANLAIMRREGLVERADARRRAARAAGCGRWPTTASSTTPAATARCGRPALHPHQNADRRCATRCCAGGVITRAINTDTLTFCPPLVITDEQIDRIVEPSRCATAAK